MTDKDLRLSEDDPGRELSKEEEKMLEIVLDVVGGEQKAFTYYDDTKTIPLDLLFCKNSPGQGYMTCTTLGLLNHDIGFESRGKTIRIELIGVSHIKDTEYFDAIARIMCRAGFAIKRGDLPCGYGSVFKSIIGKFAKGSDMKHVVFVNPPNFWKKPFRAVELEDFILTWLCLLPISDKELEYMDKNGLDALQERFVEENIDMFDLYRKSIF